jgi:uncharacterized membrane protein
MEALVILLLIILIVLLLSFRSAALDRIRRLEEEIFRLRKEWMQSQPLPQTGTASKTPPAAPVETPPGRAAPQPAAPTAATPEETEPFAPAPRPQPSYQSPPRPVQPVASVTQSVLAEIAQPHHFPERRSAPPPPLPTRPPSPGFFDRHPDLEKFIGENLVSKIGIAVLVLAIGFFVKYAIDNDWIGPVGRVGIGLLCGGILIGIAHWMRNSYKAFSSVLVGGGLAIFYFTIALAYHQYGLFSQTAAFIIMLVITAFSVILSMLYDRQELAIIALVGGFVTPFLVSHGNGNYKVLFSYLLILNTGLLVIAYNKAWRLLNGLAFGFTVILFISWLISLPSDAGVSAYSGGFGFATAFYVLFFVINIAHNIRENKKFLASDFGILLANTCLYFGAGLYLLMQMRLLHYQGLFSATMAVFNLVSSWLLFRTKKVDSNILYLLIGITLSFTSLTAPIQLHGHYITLFWASESVLLYWLYQKSQIKIVRLASYGVFVAMLVSLWMDWWNIYWTVFDIKSGLNPVPLIFNKGFLTSLYSALCCFALFRLSRDKPLAKAFLLTGCVLLFVGGALETWHQVEVQYPGTDQPMQYLLLYGYSFLLLFTIFSNRIKDSNFQLLNGILLAVCLGAYLFSIKLGFEIQRNILESHTSGSHFMPHWAADLVIIVILCRLTGWERAGALRIDPALFTWIAGALTVIFLSVEGQLLVNAVFYSKEHPLEELQRVYSKTGLPILWGLCSFAFMWLGMRHKFKTLRIGSLFLFSLTLVKLFLFDIRNIPVAGKIAAFFCLGVLLLVVSFMYQRLKKIITEDEEKEKQAH